MDIFRDPETMEPAELRAYLADVREELEAMDEDEPEDETSEEFVDWAERHEELEDLADELKLPDPYVAVRLNRLNPSIGN